MKKKKKKEEKKGAKYKNSNKRNPLKRRTAFLGFLTPPPQGAPKKAPKRGP